MTHIDYNQIASEAVSTTNEGINLLQANTRFVEEMVKK